MDDLLALDGGRAATQWKKRHAKLQVYIERIRKRRAAQDVREARWDLGQRRKVRLAKFERNLTQSKRHEKRRKAQAKRDKVRRKTRRKKLCLKIEQADRRAVLKRRKADGYRNPRLPYKDLTGRRFGRLLVIRPGGHNPSGSKRWWVQCDCGSPIKEIAGTNLQQGILRSCGCLMGNAGRERLRKSADKAKSARRQIRGALSRWQKAFSASAGDAKLLRRLRSAVQWAEARMADASKPRLRQLPTMKDAKRRIRRR